MRLACFVIAALSLVGCASASPPPPVEHAAPPDAPARIETETFALEITAQPASVAISLEGRGELHVNLDYPLQIDLEASGAELDKSTLGPADAAELSAERARFEVPVRFAAAGEPWIAARVRFAVCTDETCIPEQRSIAIRRAPQ